MGLQEIDPGTSRRSRQTDFSPEEGRPFQVLLPKDEIGYFLTVQFHVTGGNQGNASQAPSQAEDAGIPAWQGRWVLKSLPA